MVLELSVFENAFGTCCICEEKKFATGTFDDSGCVSLNCLHTACRKSIETLSDPACKVCGFGRKSLVSCNTLIYQLLKSLSDEQSRAKPVCTNCTDNQPSEHACLDCDELVCAACIPAHSRIKSTKSHVMKQLSLFSQTEARRFASKRVVTCFSHNVAATFFCNSCQLAACNDCLSAHQGHQIRNTEQLANEAQKIRGFIENVVVPQLGKHSSQKLQRKVFAKIDASINAAGETHNKFCADLDAAVNRYMNQIRQRANVAKNEVKTVIDNFVDCCREQQDTVRNTDKFRRQIELTISLLNDMACDNDIAYSVVGQQIVNALNMCKDYVNHASTIQQPTIKWNFWDLQRGINNLIRISVDTHQRESLQPGPSASCFNSKQKQQQMVENNLSKHKRSSQPPSPNATKLVTFPAAPHQAKHPKSAGTSSCLNKRNPYHKCTSYCWKTHRSSTAQKATSQPPVSPTVKQTTTSKTNSSINRLSTMSGCNRNSVLQPTTGVLSSSAADLLENDGSSYLLLRFEAAGVNPNLRHKISSYSLRDDNDAIISFKDSRSVPAEYIMVPGEERTFSASVILCGALEYSCSFGLIFLVGELDSGTVSGTRSVAAGVLHVVPLVKVVVLSSNMSYKAQQDAVQVSPSAEANQSALEEGEVCDKGEGEICGISEADACATVTPTPSAETSTPQQSSLDLVERVKKFYKDTLFNPSSNKGEKVYSRQFVEVAQGLTLAQQKPNFDSDPNFVKFRPEILRQQQPRHHMLPESKSTSFQPRPNCFASGFQVLAGASSSMQYNESGSSGSKGGGVAHLIDVANPNIANPIQQKRKKVRTHNEGGPLIETPAFNFTYNTELK